MNAVQEGNDFQNIEKCKILKFRIQHLKLFPPILSLAKTSEMSSILNAVKLQVSVQNNSFIRTKITFFICML